jgi:hypothetical protein
LHESDKEHEKHHKNNKKIWVWFRLDITNPEIYGSWKSCKDQKFNIYSILLSLNYHDLVREGFSSKPKP